jgi:hypothetical protein
MDHVPREDRCVAQLAKHIGIGIVALLCLWALYVDILRSW